MKKKNSEKPKSDDDKMLLEYDFTKMKGGQRGKFYKAYRAGHTVKISKKNKTTAIQYFKLEDGAVMLEPDVRTYFQDSETVNNILRSLIAILPTKQKEFIKENT